MWAFWRMGSSFAPLGFSQYTVIIKAHHLDNNGTVWFQRELRSLDAFFAALLGTF